MKHWLILNLHRLIADRTSIGVYLPRVTALCAAAIGAGRNLRASTTTAPQIEYGTPLATPTPSARRRVDLRPKGDRMQVRALAARLPEAPSDHTTEIIAEETSSPLSCNQLALYFLDRASPASAAYNLGLAVRLRSTVSLGALRHSVQALIDRHAMLRTIYEDGPAGPVQIARGRCEVVLDAIDSSGSTEDQLQTQVERHYQQPFDLKSGPIVRAALFTRCESDHVLLLTVHHIAADPWSVRLMFDELRTLYEAHVTDRPASLPQLEVTYPDFVRQQREMLEGPEGQSLKEYWLRQLQDLPAPLELPGDRARLPGAEEGGGTIAFELSEALSRRLKALAQERETTLFTVVMAAFQVLLSRYSGRIEILVGTLASGRAASKFRSTLGDFTNPVVVRGNLASNPSFSDLLRDMTQTVVDAVAHEAYPFVSLVQSLGVVRDHSRSPVFQTMFVLRESQRTTDQAGLFTPVAGRITNFGGVRAEPYSFRQQEGQLDVTLEVIDVGRTLFANLKYKAERFERSTIEQLRVHFETLLEGIVENPNRRVSDIPLLTAEEQSRILRDWNSTAAAYPAELGLDGLFEAQVRRTPDRVAVLQAGREVTYGVLNDRANQIAHRLRALGVGPGVLVAVGLPRTPDLVATLLAVAKAGGAYLPMDPSYPVQRLSWMLEDAKPAVLVTDCTLATTWPEHVARVLCLDDPAERLTEEGAANLGMLVSPEEPAYVIFTSGSTGRPKGVQISRRALVNFLTAMELEPGLSERSRLLATTTLSFDMSVLELFLPIVTGSSVVLATRDEAMDGARLRRLLVESGATVMQATPGTWRMLVEAGWPGSTAFRVFCGGEPMPRDLADALLDRAAEVWNLYGPTETTVYSTVERVKRGAPITVGRPVANTQVYVLGRGGELQPAGVIGELWIGGDGLANGYVGQPELTAQRFLPNPFVPGTRMYATGDVVRWTADGRLEHLGRSDDQVKIRGFRIELGEIETALGAHPSVRQAAAVAFGAPSDARIVAYVVPEGQSIDASALRQHARERLPEYMVPAVVLPLVSLPATTNGKLDRKALLASTAAALLNAGGERPPSTTRRTPVEGMLVSIWADVLGAKKVGIEDDFFELGGHSLLAARLMQQLSDIFWMDLPLRLLFDAPTIAKMAAVIQQRLDTKHADASTTDVLEINSSGIRPPFIFLHAALQGDGFYCFNLARHLGEDQPMYALAPLGLDGSETPPTVEAIASRQLQIIRRIQPHGPYYLGGFCSSGPIAFELARMLKAAGERVEIVVLIESDIDECNRLVRFSDRAVGVLARVVRLSPAQRLTAFLVLRRCVRRAGQLSASTVREGATAVVDHVRSAVSTRVSALRQRRARARDGGRAATARERQHALAQAVGCRYDRAIEGFVPQRYDGRVVALKAEESLSVDTTVAWRMAAPDLRLQVVKGDHNTCITSQVDSLGTHLRIVLREAQDTVLATSATHRNAAG